MASAARPSTLGRVYKGPLYVCARCEKLTTEESVLKQCDCCQAVYCSAACFEAYKAEHPKRPQPKSEGNTWYSPATYEATKGLHAAPGQPFTRLDRGTYLHDRPRLDVFRLLLDCYRLRLDDDIKIYGTPEPVSLHTGFHRFVELAEQRPNLLPPWWDDIAMVECMTVFDAGGGDPAPEWYNLDRRVSRNEINKHYGQPYMDVQLRLLGEAVYQRGPGNQKGTEILELMVRHENYGQEG